MDGKRQFSSRCRVEPNYNDWADLSASVEPGGGGLWYFLKNRPRSDVSTVLGLLGIVYIANLSLSTHEPITPLQLAAVLSAQFILGVIVVVSLVPRGNNGKNGKITPESSSE